MSRPLVVPTALPARRRSWLPAVALLAFSTGEACDRRHVLGAFMRDAGGDQADAGGGDVAAGDANAGDATDGAEAPPALEGPKNLVFVTSQPVSLQGLTVELADGHCNAAAKSAGLPGSYKAWLSTSTRDAREALAGARGWVRPDDKPVADTLADLLGGRLLYPPRLDENGRPVPARERVYTGTLPSGVSHSYFTCSDWKVVPGIQPGYPGSVTGAYGEPSATTGRWTTSALSYCPDSSRLYCFGVDRATPVPAPAATAKVAFVSDATFSMGGGLQAADALCAREARAVGLPGTFLALLATPTTSAAARFDDVADARWVRTDGVPLTAPGRALFDDGPDVPLNVTSRRRYLGGGEDATFTGADTPRSLVPHPSANCHNWTSTDSVLAASAGSAADAGNWWGTLAEVVWCSSSDVHVYCLQHDGPSSAVGGARPHAAPPSPPLNYVFVSAGIYSTQSRGEPLAEADGQCNREAAAAGLPGAYVAWLSTRAVDARDRLGDARGWIRPDGAPFADTVDDIIAGRIFTAPRVDPFGNLAPAPPGVATGTSTTGVVDLPNTCHDWTDGTSPLLDVAMGIPATTEGDWTLTTTRSAVYTYTQCGYPTHRYCFGVDHVTPLPPSADAGRLAFVTAQTFSPGGGIAAADALCESEARAGGLTGSFAALLASSTQSAADRFAPFWGRTWIRTDGVALNDPGEILFDQPELRAPLNATSTKTVVAGDVFTGAESVGAVGQPASTCQDWTSTAGTTRGGRSSNLARWWSGRGVACSAPQHLYCFQR